MKNFYSRLSLTNIFQEVNNLSIGDIPDTFTKGNNVIDHIMGSRKIVKAAISARLIHKDEMIKSTHKSIIVRFNGKKTFKNKHFTTKYRKQISKQIYRLGKISYDNRKKFKEYQIEQKIEELHTEEQYNNFDKEYIEILKSALQQ